MIDEEFIRKQRENIQNARFLRWEQVKTTPNELEIILNEFERLQKEVEHNKAIFTNRYKREQDAVLGHEIRQKLICEFGGDDLSDDATNTELLNLLDELIG